MSNDVLAIIEWTDEVGIECKRLLGDNVSALDHLQEIEVGRIILDSALNQDCTVEQAALQVLELAGVEL